MPSLDVARFRAALDAEINSLDRDGRVRSIELHSGILQSGIVTISGLTYEFSVNDATKLREDAPGKIRIDSKTYAATVVAQEGNRVWIHVDRPNVAPNVASNAGSNTSRDLAALSPKINRATISFSETELLKRLRDALLPLSSAPKDSLLQKVFNPKTSKSGIKPLPALLARRVDPRSRAIYEQCIGSEVTFLWGPPGTGKTFSIATIVAALIASGESVLVTSHTHAAVEQALFALVEPSNGDRDGGPLAGSALVDQGRIFKIGQVKQDKIPRMCQFEGVVADFDKDRFEQIDALSNRKAKLENQFKILAPQLQAWNEFMLQGNTLKQIRVSLDRTRQDFDAAAKSFRMADIRLQAAKAALQSAESAPWIFRNARIEKAHGELRQIQLQMNKHNETGTQLKMQLAALRTDDVRQYEIYSKALDKVRVLRAKDDLEHQSTAILNEIAVIDEQLAKLLEGDSTLAKRVIDQSVAIFATITKLFTDKMIADKTWDAVIIDEASMANLPLIAIAAARATKRVIVVGDFRQLPPIVQSKEKIAIEELGIDIFQRVGIDAAVDRSINAQDDPPYLAQLSQQRRMHPKIASIARSLVYGNRLLDHPSVTTRIVPEWISALGTSNALVAVDTTRLGSRTASPRDSKSRFNQYSAQCCVELAAMYVARIATSDPGEVPPIGIVTPFAEQRRILNKLIEANGLSKWIIAGTVHTFQGNECDVVIFDTVVASPQREARLADPNAFKSVRRDLNVAVTRAKHQLVLVGDFDWFRRNAKPGSGYRKLFDHFQSDATYLDARDLVGEKFASIVSKDPVGTSKAGNALSETLSYFDQTSFYGAFESDLAAARTQVVLCTPYLGRRRWPQVQRMITALPSRGVRTIVLHKPLDEWEGDLVFERKVLETMAKSGVELVAVKGIHNKTIVIDHEIVYDGSLNWASQTTTEENMWRFVSSQMAIQAEERFDDFRNSVG